MAGGVYTITGVTKNSSIIIIVTVCCAQAEVRLLSKNQGKATNQGESEDGEERWTGHFG